MSGNFQPRPKLGRWKAELDRLLAKNAAAAPRERLTLIRIFEDLRALGYDGGYDAVRRYARGVKPGARGADGCGRGRRVIPACRASWFRVPVSRPTRGPSHAATSCSNAASARRLSRSRSTVTTASFLPPCQKLTVQSWAAGSPSMSTRSHCSAWPT